ncbi:hypothetical protein [Embleya sp. NPDC059237]|uniref:hypothetical protein n=1 Tax=Embleya sp. NPDC059237 TaxID=3346784 RepID=UPI0036CA7FFC
MDRRRLGRGVATAAAVPLDDEQGARRLPVEHVVDGEHDERLVDVDEPAAEVRRPLARRRLAT